jgi:tetratricopeptide (TPR) repeat protein
LIALSACLVYGNSFKGAFLFDDWPTILENESIRNWKDLGAILFPPPSNSASGRPLLNLSLAVNYAFSGTSVWSYHLLNLAIHVGAALALFGLVRRTLEQPLLKPRLGHAAIPIGFVSALVWAVHPLQTEAVTYIIQRAESMMGLFYFVTLYAFARAVNDSPSMGWRVVAIGACALGMTSKEVMVSAPLIALLYDRAFVTGSFREAWNRHRGLLLGLAFTWIALAGSLVLTGGNRNGSKGFGIGISAWDFWLTQPRALFQYLKLTVWPHPLAFEYGIEWVSRPSDVIPYALVIVPLATAAIVALFRWPQWGFLGAWFFAVLAPSSLAPGDSQMTVEHRMYVPLASVISLLVVMAYCRLGRRGLVLGLSAAVVFGALTLRRNADYRDALTMWGDTIAKRPSNALAHRIYADFLWQDGNGVRRERLPQALQHYQEALRLRPTSLLTHENYAAALLLTGDVTGGIRHCLEALALDPNRHLPHYNLGLAYVGLGRLEDAAREFAAAVQARPSYVNAHKNLGNALAELGRPQDAIPHYEAALKLKPGDPEAHYNLGNAWFKLGRYDEAIAAYRAALSARPEDVDALSMLGTSLSRAGRPGEAAPYLERAAQLKFDALLTRDRQTTGPAPLEVEIDRGR